MGRPQQPELARSGKTDLDPDRIGTELGARSRPRSEGPTGPVPPDNQPGHHPDEEQDKPDPGAFAARLQGEEQSPSTAGPPLAVSIARVSGQLTQRGLRLAEQGLRRGVQMTAGGLQSLQRQVTKRTHR